MLVGVYDIDIYGEAGRSRQGFSQIDFLTGKSTGAVPSLSLRDAIHQYKEGLTHLCTKHSITSQAFRTLTAHYSRDKIGNRTVLTTANQQRRRSAKEYIGVPGKRIRVLHSPLHSPGICDFDARSRRAGPTATLPIHGLVAARPLRPCSVVRADRRDIESRREGMGALARSR